MHIFQTQFIDFSYQRYSDMVEKVTEYFKGSLGRIEIFLTPNEKVTSKLIFSWLNLNFFEVLYGFTSFSQIYCREHWKEIFSKLEIRKRVHSSYIEFERRFPEHS